MKKKWKNLGIITLAAVLGLGCTANPVKAQESGDNSLQSEIGSMPADMRKDGSIFFQKSELENTFRAHYGQRLSDIELPEGWVWENPDLVLNEEIEELGIGYNYFPARFDVSRYEEEYDFSGVGELLESDHTLEYNQEGHYVAYCFEVFVAMAPSTIVFKEDLSLDKEYDGEPVSVSENDVITTGSTGEVVIQYDEKKWSAFGTEYWSRLEEAPSEAGIYKVTAILWHDRWHDTAKIERLFTISKADTELWFTADNIDKVYDGKTADPQIHQWGSSHAPVLSWYSLKDDGEWEKLEKAPVNAGSYKVTATVEPDDNYNGAEVSMSFEIAKALPAYTLPGNLSLKQGETLSSVKLPEGFAWKDDSQTADTLGKQNFKAIYTPADTVNYQSAEVDITVQVLPAAESADPVPDITEEDKTETAGDTSEPVKETEEKDKTALQEPDKENKGTDTETGSQVQSSDTKTGTSVQSSDTKTDSPVQNSSTKTAVKTGDHTNIFMWAVLGGISGIIVLSAVLFRHRKQRLS